MAHSAVSALAVENLAGSFSGRLVQPGDAHYDEARTVWNGYFDPHRR